jgi:hypothetical protein
MSGIILLEPLVYVFRWALQPIPPFTWLGLGISSLDVAAAVRLCLVLRQLRESLHAEHMRKTGDSVTATGTKSTLEIERKSFVKDLSTTLTVVYGGEAMTSPLLGLTPSFMVSGVVPALYATIQAFIELLPVVPAASLALELPLSLLDGFTRAYLLCDLIPPAVTTHASPIVATSPWTLLITSLIAANGGFFLTNMFSFLHPTPFTLTTPPELGPYGWTTTDLWCAPLITGLFALLTHAQPFWANLHVVIIQLLGGHLDENKDSKLYVAAEAVDPEVARVVCALLLVAMFTTRTVKNFASPLVFNLVTDSEELNTGSKSLSSIPSPGSKPSHAAKASVSPKRPKAGKTKIQ